MTIDLPHLELVDKPAWYEDIVELDTHGVNLVRLTPQLQHALMDAAYAHEGQRRKLADLPFLAHPFETMLLVAECLGVDIEDVEPGSRVENLLIAAILHDTVEDSRGKMTQAIIRKEYGEEVGAIVSDATKHPDLQGSECDQEYFSRLTTTDTLDSLRIVAADKTHALICKANEHYKLGEDAHRAFNVSREEKLAYFTSIYEIVEARLPAGDPFVREFHYALSMYSEQQRRSRLQHIATALSRASTRDL